MDFPVAAPVREALAAAVDRDDLGYASTDAARLGPAFAEFAARRYGWDVDPAQVTPVNDVVAALIELVARAHRARRRRVDQPARLPPVLRRDRATPAASWSRCRCADGARRSTWTRSSARSRPGPGSLILCNPHNPTGGVLGRAELARSPRSRRATAPGCSPTRSTRRWSCRAPSTSRTSVSDAAAERGDRAHLGVEGVQHRRAQVRGRRHHRERDRARWSPAARSPCTAATSGCSPRSRLGARRRMARRAIGVPRRKPVLLAELLAARLPAVGYAPPQAELPGVARLPCARARRRPGGGVPRARPRRAQRRARSSATGAPGFARLNFATSPALARGDRRADGGGGAVVSAAGRPRR